MKILINALSGNGDALMFSPALRLLKDKLPGSQIDMLVMFKSVKEMYQEHPCLSSVFYLDLLKQSKLKSIREIRQLRSRDYDYAINVYPANRLEYNLVNAFLGAKKKIAHHYLHSNMLRAEFFNDILINEINDRHNVLQNLDLIKPIVPVSDEEAGAMEIFISGEQKKKAEEWIRENELTGSFIAGFHPGSSILKNHIHKRWDKAKYAGLGRWLIEKYNAKILLFGNEFELNNEIRSMMNGEAIIASTHNYMDSVSRMSHCRLFISNDTAFMHTAAALQIPTVAVFGYTNYKELYPWKTSSVIVRKDLHCSPCFYNSPSPVSCIYTGSEEFKCMSLIEVNEVCRAAEQLMKRE